MTTFSPREIVSELDRFIVGQNDAKRAVAIALRKPLAPGSSSPARSRRGRPEEHPDDRTDRLRQDRDRAPAGETRRSAVPEDRGRPSSQRSAMSGADVEQIVRDLVEVGIGLKREERRRGVQAKAEAAAEARILDALVGPASSQATRDSFRKKLRASELDDKEVEIELSAPRPPACRCSRIPACQAPRWGRSTSANARQGVRRPEGSPAG